MEITGLRRNEIILFSVVALLLIFWGNHSTVLFNQDEAAYAGFAKQFLSTSNWLIPEFHWSDVHRKTPFHFWMIALSYLIFGINEFAVRFSSSLAILGTLGLIYFHGRQIFTDRIAFHAIIILLSSILFVALGKIAVTDATLLFFQTWAAITMIQFLRTERSGYVLQFWLAVTFGMLTKGPPIILFTGFLGLLLLIFHPDGKKIWKLRPFILFPLSLIPLLIWGYLAWQVDDGDFITWLIDWYILRRVDGNVFGQTGPPGYYVLIFIFSFIIWIPDLINVLIRSFRVKDKSSWLFIGTWLIAGWLAYEFVSSKLPAYTIAAHPAIALGIAYYISHEDRSRIRLLKWSYALFALVMFIGGIMSVAYGHLIDLGNFNIPVAILLLSISMICGLQAWELFTSRSLTSRIIWLSLLPNFILWFWILPMTQDGLGGLKQIGEFVGEQSKGQYTEVTIGQAIGKPPALPFYLERQGLTVSFESDTVKMYEKYNSVDNGAFILSEEQLKFIRPLTPGIEVFEMQSFDVDHQKMQPYFVALKK